MRLARSGPALAGGGAPVVRPVPAGGHEHDGRYDRDGKKLVEPVVLAEIERAVVHSVSEGLQ